MREIKIGAQLVPQYGDVKRLRERWMEAEALGVDRLWNADHFHAQVLDENVARDAAHSNIRSDAKNFESTTLLAAIAATTTRVEMGCMVHANSYRNPNLMADIARTIDHLSNGRFILGIGSGYLKADYDEYGYEYGTTASRLQDLARDLPIIKERFRKLNPPPVRRIPIMVASMGDKIGLRIVAEHADIWNVYGPVSKLEQKIEVLRQHCRDIGRDVNEIEFQTVYLPSLLPDSNPDTYFKMGFREIYVSIFGPDWNLGPLRELLSWRKALQAGK